MLSLLEALQQVHPGPQLAGVEDVVWVQRPLHGVHRLQGRRPVLGQQVRQLAVADAVLSRTRALQGRRTTEESANGFKAYAGCWIQGSEAGQAMCCGSW